MKIVLILLGLTINNLFFLNDYEVRLRKVVVQIKATNEIDLEILETIVPKSEFEFSIYWSFYNDNNFKKTMEMMDQKISECAFNSIGEFYKLYFQMNRFINSESVNDEYLANYYYNIDFIIENDESKFCKFYDTQNKDLNINLIDFYEMYCL